MFLALALPVQLVVIQMIEIEFARTFPEVVNSVIIVFLRAVSKYVRVKRVRLGLAARRELHFGIRGRAIPMCLSSTGFERMRRPIVAATAADGIRHLKFCLVDNPDEVPPNSGVIWSKMWMAVGVKCVSSTSRAPVQVGLGERQTGKQGDQQEEENNSNSRKSWQHDRSSFFYVR
jgi:hypothetical protein